MIKCVCNEIDSLNEVENLLNYKVFHLMEISINIFDNKVLYYCDDADVLWMEYKEQPELKDESPVLYKKISKSEAEEEFFLRKEFWNKLNQFINKFIVDNE